jgi:hypothetical protein
MQDLASLEEFAAQDAPVNATIEVAGFSGGVFAVALLIGAFLTEWSAQGAAFWRSLLLAVAYGIAFGLCAAGLQYLADRGKLQRKSEQSLHRLFAADATIVPPAPPQATERLFCAVLVERGGFVGGALYVQPDGLFFQPHYLRPRWFRARIQQPLAGVRIHPPRTVTLEPRYLMPPDGWRRWLRRRPVPLLICSWEGGKVALWVPHLPVVQSRLQRCVDRLRDAGAV